MNTDPVAEQIEEGEHHEVGAVTITRTGGELVWFNQQHTPCEGNLTPGESIAFQSGERLGFFADEQAAIAYLDACIEADIAVLRDLGFV